MRDQVTAEVAADSEVDANNQCVDMQPLDLPGPSHTSIEVSGCSRNVEENSSESDTDLPPVSFTAPKLVYSTSCMSVTLFYACTNYCVQWFEGHCHTMLCQCSTATVALYSLLNAQLQECMYMYACIYWLM